MSEHYLHYEIRDIDDPDGGLILELHAEGQRVATARASADVLAAMESELGMSRSEVHVGLEAALARHMSHQLAKVEVTPPRDEPPGGLRFASQYFYQDFDDEISTGVVWYDVPEGTTGPDDLPAVVRNRMRFEVHSKLTARSPIARGLVDLLK